MIRYLTRYRRHAANGTCLSLPACLGCMASKQFSGNVHRLFGLLDSVMESAYIISILRKIKYLIYCCSPSFLCTPWLHSHQILPLHFLFWIFLTLQGSITCMWQCWECFSTEVRSTLNEDHSCFLIQSFEFCWWTSQYHFQHEFMEWLSVKKIILQPGAIKAASLLLKLM